MIEAVGDALAVILTPQGMFVLLLGTAIGMLVSVLPGLGGATALALLLPITFGMATNDAFLFSVSLLAAGGFAGSITAILVNVPGDSTNAATLLDGYPMSKAGRAGEALGASATASALGALFGVSVLALSLPFIRDLILVFGPGEVFAAALGGVVMISMVGGQSSQLRALIAGAFGMLLGLIGQNLLVGGTRFTFGSLYLFEGIPIVPALIGLFAIPEAVALLRSGGSISGDVATVRGGVMLGVRTTLKRIGLVAQSGLIGTAVGIIPGVGGSVSSWVAYYAASRRTKDPTPFGEGNIDGVIGPEASNDAKDGGSMMPVLALGIPGSVSTAVLMGVFIIHGVVPGQQMFQQRLDLIWVIILGMLAANFISSFIGLAVARWLVKVTLIPTRILVPIVVVLAFIGAYAAVTSYYGVVIAVAIGFLGYLMRKGGFSRAAFVLGIILSPLIEQNFILARRLNRGSFDFLLRPVTLSILATLGLVLLFPLLRRIWRQFRVSGRLQALLSESVPITSADDDESEGASEVSRLLVLGVGLVGCALFAWSATQLDGESVVYPIGIITITSTLLLIEAISWFLDQRSGKTSMTDRISMLASGGRELASDLPTWGAILLFPVLLYLFGTIPAATAFFIAFEYRRLVEFEPVALLKVAVRIIVIVLLLQFAFIDLLGLRISGLLI